MRKHPVECFSCGTEIEWSNECPHGAVVFTTHGNYGSKVFDSMHEFLYGVICDDCITGAGDRLRVQDAVRKRPTYDDLGSYTEWDKQQIAKYKAMKWE